MTTHPNTEQRKKLERYDIPGHAHELTFSCYHRFHYLNDPICCTLFIGELSQAREHFLFVTADLARPEACPQLDWGARATKKKACTLYQSIDMGTRALSDLFLVVQERRDLDHGPEESGLLDRIVTLKVTRLFAF